MPYYEVKQGDCVSSIAFEFGFYWKTIWNHPNNRPLKNSRKDHHILYPGDQLFIPERSLRIQSCETDHEHVFQKLGTPEVLRLRLMAGPDPVANTDYVLTIDGHPRHGTTDDDGNLEEPIQPNNRRATLRIGESEDELPINLGHLDPLDEATGIQGRLNNLGFFCGSEDGEWGPETTQALKNFQKSRGLEESGEVDGDTRSALEAAHLV